MFGYVWLCLVMFGYVKNKVAGKEDVTKSLLL